MKSANRILESPSRIEPVRLASVPEEVNDLVAELSAASSSLGNRLHQKTASNLADLVRVMNCYYSNLIEGHNTRPRDIERALTGDFDTDESRRSLQIEATAHIRVQQEIDQQFALGELPEPASSAFIQWLHLAFYHGASSEMLTIKKERVSFVMTPGEWRTLPEHDNAVGRHVPPSSERVADFMSYFEEKYRFDNLRAGGRILAMAAGHHRFNYIHPFPDGNGRVSRLMSHAMGLQANIGAHGLWSVSRGLARGIDSRSEYKAHMDHADTERQGDLDGRGNLSEKALVDFVTWYLRVCLDQVLFMSSLFDLGTLSNRLQRYVERSETLKPEANYLLQEALIRGEFERGAASRITGLPERTARRVLNSLVDEGLLGSSTPKSPVSLRFPANSLEALFPKLYSQA
jgi:Fic family protein